ncbi:MAG: hypothetical protein FK734_01325 [Asgard group archaeon]|nr:hypothetical protein [Asgard group archaeon]
MGSLRNRKNNGSINERIFKAGTVDKLTYALMKFGDQQIHAILTFDEYFDLDLFVKAYELILEVEPVLKSRFVYHDKKPYWKVKEDIKQNEYFTIIKTDKTDEEIFNYIITPCNPEIDNPIQIRILRNSKQDVLLLKTNHAIVDGGGIIEFLELLAKNYKQLTLNPNYTLDSYISEGRDLKQVLRKFNIFQKIFIFFKNMSSKPNWAFPWIGNKQTAPNYIIRRFEPEQFRKIKTYGKKFNATINDMVLTAFYRSVFKLLNIKHNEPLVTVVTINLRMYLQDKKGYSICNLSSSAYPRIAYVPNENFAETLSRVHKEMNFRKKYAPGIGPAFFIENVFRMPFSRVVNSIRKRYEKDLKRKATHPVFTNVGLMRTQDIDFGSINAVDGYIMTPIMKSPGFIFGLVTFNETMSINAGFYKGSYDKKTFETFFDNISDELLSIED